MTFTLEEVLEATGGRLLCGKREVVFPAISTDSRRITEGALFVALKGRRFDGHQFVVEALAKRAGGVLIEEGKAEEVQRAAQSERPVILVKDTLRALGDMARHRRQKFGISVVGLTGSNGKTTTKELIAACLETSFPVLKTMGNFNNLIGLPLTLLQLTGKEKVAVLEMGMNVPGEIGRLTEIAAPDVGLITNIQRAHLEGLGSLERIQQEKGDLFLKMRQDGTIIVNLDDLRVVELGRKFPGRKITIGIENRADIMAKEIRTEGREGTSFRLFHEGGEAEVRLPLIGRHFVYHGLFAIATAKLFGIGTEEILKALETFQPAPMRMEVLSLEGGVNLINDAYNANPDSMEMALRTLSEVKGEGRAIAVLGDMLELGDFTVEAHRQLGRKAALFSIDLLLVMGEEAALVVESALQAGMAPDRAKRVSSPSEAARLIKAFARQGDWILVKGSRGMAMERVVEILRREKEEKDALSSALPPS
ncbi:MAG: UDP-N-acetylmuramoyl-tripeptide--D-alanyl-D-alanine ligase [Desulfobacterota bacterium]|nr:UDP-N-acetylmuramoyl-tripeptide--D-alanyl-D-alanine ligase [Thermodesulfobacteriota bacterium]